MSKYHEIEYKWRANHVSIELFKQFKKFLGPLLLSSSKTQGPDTYYVKKGSVIRFRTNLKGTFQELTTKRRISNKSTTTREEIDLKLKNVSKQDVDTFLSADNYKEIITLYKKCNILEVSCKYGLATIVLYDISKGDSDWDRYIEVEGNKNQSISKNKKVINYWKKIIERELSVEPHHLSQFSLYEIYTNRRYPLK